MQLTALAKQIRHFKRRRELQDVAKQPLANPETTRKWIDEYFELTRQEDDGPKDYDPLPGRVFKTEEGRTVGATYTGECLERSEIYYRERRTLHVHQSPIAIQAFWSWSHPDYPQLVECFQVALQDSGASFYQRLELAPEPWV